MTRKATPATPATPAKGKGRRGAPVVDVATAAAAAAAPEAEPVADVAAAAAAAAAEPAAAEPAAAEPAAAEPAAAEPAAAPAIALIKRDGKLDYLAILASMKQEESKGKNKDKDKPAKVSYSQPTVEAVASLGWRFPKGGKTGRAPQDLCRLSEPLPTASKSDVVKTILVFAYFGDGSDKCKTLANYDRIRVTDYVTFLRAVWPLIEGSGWAKSLDTNIVNLANCLGRYVLIEGDYLYLSATRPDGFRFRDRDNTEA